MLFTSFEFPVLLFFLGLIYYLVPGRVQWIVLLVCNVLFLSGNGKAAVLLFFMTGITWIFSAVINRCQNKKQRRQIFLLSLFFQVGIILYFKLFCDNMPFGLAYYGLMTISYQTEIYRKHTKWIANPLQLVTAVSFFPLLVQGPVTLYDNMEKILQTHRFQMNRVCFAIQRILWGYFKKLAVADRIVPVVQVIIGSPSEYTGLWVLLGMLFYAVQLYADFTGGIDITLGIAQFLGMEFPENFNVPFTSKNLGEYWRRWHISLGEWIKNYIFYPLSVSRLTCRLAKTVKKKSPSAGKRVPVYLASFAAWFVTGLWHGRQLHFIVWGLANCAVILASRELKEVYDHFHKRYPGLKENMLYGYFQAVRTFLLVCVLRMTDCYKDVGLTIKMFIRMFTDPVRILPSDLLVSGMTLADYIVLAVGILLMYLVGKRKKKENLQQWYDGFSPVRKCTLCILTLFAVLIFGSYGIGYDARQFIYNEV